MFLKASFYSILALSALAAQADDYFEASQVCTMQSQNDAADRYQQVDFSQFVAGSAAIPYEFNSVGNPTMKGFAYFDLEQDGLREAIQNEDGRHLVLSFILLQVQGKPRPLRVEYIGTFKDKDSDQSRAQQFQANEIARADSVLEQTAEPGLKMVDVTSLVKQDLTAGRWLVIRFEQDGLRIEDGVNDLYQFNANNSTVRLTLTKDKNILKAVTNHYQSDGVGGILPDMQANALPDMNTKNITPDLQPNALPDMNTKNILPDMQSNILPDMQQGSIIDDQNNQQ
jgi:hypothetical protein